MRAECFLLLLATTSVAYADAPSPPQLTVNAVFDGQRGPSGTAQTTPDVGGASGSEQVIDVVSGFVTIRDGVAGDVLASTTADVFWTAAGVTGTPAAFSQHAVFSALNQRWYISAEEATNGVANRIYLAVSATWDARGPWKAVTLSPQAQQITNTRLAVDGCGAYVTGDIGGSGVVMALPFVDLQWTGTGAPSAAHLNVMPATAGVVPAIDSWNDIGSDARMFIARDVVNSSVLDLFKLHWASPLCSSTLTATLGAASSVPLGTGFPAPSRAAFQPAPAPGLDAGTGAITSADSSNGSIVGIATMEISGRLGAVWFQLYANPSSTAAPVIEQVGRIMDPSADLIMPAIALDPYNGIGVVVVRTSAMSPPAIYVTAHGYTDGIGEMRPLLVARAGTAAYSCAPTAGVSGFGRYSSIASTATGFWATAQYGASSTACEFGTAWVNFGVQNFPDNDGWIGDDGGFGHPDEPSPPFTFSCAGCATRGDATSSLGCVFAVAFVLRRRRSRR